MRNLKRALSLALAMVMVLSMTVIGASAVSVDDFTDADEIVNTEAVTTMVSLGVIDGNDDGSYNPTGVVKRGEMAKLIAVMLNGGNDPTLGETPVVFADTAGHWAQNYISYVANLHIIDGRGDGSFGPNDDVTGSEAAKMLLTALGYRSDLEGFTGANWAINVQAMANQVELFDGLTINPDEGLTRDDTAQMIYNAVQADMVEYRNLEGSYDGIVYPQPLNGSGDSTVLYERFHVRKVEGVVQATSLIALEGQPTVEGRTRLTDIEYNGERWGESVRQSDGTYAWEPTPVTYPIAIDSELLGQRVVIYVKGLNDLAPNASSMEVVGTAIVSDDNTVVVTTSRLKDEKAVRDALKGSGIAVEGASEDGITITWDDTSAAKNGHYTGITTGLSAYPGVEQTFIDNNDDGSVDVIIRKAPGLAKVNTYNETAETMNLSGLGTIDFVDVLDPENVAQGDYVLVSDYDGTYVLEAVETVSGVVSAYRNNADNVLLSKITVEDADYGWGAGENLAPDIWDVEDYAGRALDDLVDGTYTLYLDQHGNMLGLAEDEAALGNYAVITGINTSGSEGFRSVEVKLILSDGTTGKYDVNLLATANNWDARGTGVNDGTNSEKEEAMFDVLDAGSGTGDSKVYDLVDTLVSYALNGSTVTLGRPEQNTENYHEATTTDDLGIRNGLARYAFNGATVMADDRTVFFIRDTNDDYSVTTGLANLRGDSLENTYASVIYYTAPGSSVNNARAIFAHVTDEYVSNSSYAYIAGDFDRTVEDSSYVYTYPVVDEAGVLGELKTRTDSEWIEKNTVLEYQVSGDYVAFDEDERVVNQKIVTSVRPGAVSLANVNDGVSDPVSYPTTGAAVWNVEDLDNIVSTSLQRGDKVSLVLNSDDIVQTAYIYDRAEGEYATAGTMTLLDDDAGSNMTSGGTTTLSNVVAGEELSLKVTAKPGQTVTVSATVGGAPVTLANEGKVDNTNGTTDKVETLALHTYAAAENGTEVKITVKVSQSGYDDLTMTHTVYLYGATGTTYLDNADTAAIDKVAGGAIVVIGDLDVDTALTLTSGKNITVLGDATLSANVSGPATITVNGTTTVDAAVTIAASTIVKPNNVVLAADADLTVNGTVNVTGDSLSLTGDATIDATSGTMTGSECWFYLNGHTLTLDGGTITADGIYLGSGLAGNGTLTVNYAVLVNDFTMSDTVKLTVKEDVTDETAGGKAIIMTGGTLDVAKELAADVQISSGSLKAGNIASEVVVSGDAEVGATTADGGTITNNSDESTVTVGGESVYQETEITAADAKPANLDDRKTEGDDVDADLAGTYTVTGTKHTETISETKVTYYDLVLTASALKEHQNGDDPTKTGWWAGINVAADTNDYYILNWGTYEYTDGQDIKTQLTADDRKGEEEGRTTFYRNFGDTENAQTSFYVVIKDTENVVHVYNVDCTGVVCMQ